MTLLGINYICSFRVRIANSLKLAWKQYSFLLINIVLYHTASLGQYLSIYIHLYPSLVFFYHFAKRKIKVKIYEL